MTNKKAETILRNMFYELAVEDINDERVAALRIAVLELEEQTQKKPHRNIDDLTEEKLADILYNWHRKKAPCDGCDQSDERVMRCAKAAARYYFFPGDEQKENNK